MAYRTGILFTDGSGAQDVVSLKTQASDVILADSSNLEDSLMARFKSEGVAAPFRETKTYAVGTYVTHEGFLYRCKKIITESGAWTGSENWTKVLVTDLEGGGGGGSVEEIDDTAAITSTEKVWSIGKINTVLNGNIAPTFNTSTAYSVGDFVLYNGALYKFTSAHSAGAWNASHVAAAKVTSDLSTSGSDIDDTAAINSTTKTWSVNKINTTVNANIAPTFNTSTNYAIGDLVLYNGSLYKFTSAHTAGTWNASHVASATMSAQIVKEIDDTVAATNTSKTWSIGKINTEINGNIAPSFDATHAYSIGDLVVYGGKLYKFTSNHSAGAWNASHVASTSVASYLDSAIVDEIDDTAAISSTAKTWSIDKINTTINGNVAPAFNTTTAYTTGALVIYQGKLYKFTSNHSAGEWNASQVTAVNVASCLSTAGTSDIDDTAAISSTTKTWSVSKLDSVFNGNIAQTFSATAAYSIGDYVMKDGVLYKFTSAHPAGTWNASHVSAVKLANQIASGGDSDIDDTTGITSTTKTWSIDKINTTINGNFAPTFSATTAYAIGDYVLYNGTLYKFKATHSAGAWNASHVDAVKVTSQLGESKVVAREADVTDSTLIKLTEDDDPEVINVVTEDQLREFNYDDLGHDTFTITGSEYVSTKNLYKFFDLTYQDIDKPIVVHFRTETTCPSDYRLNTTRDCILEFAKTTGGDYVSNAIYHFHNNLSSTTYRDFYNLSYAKPKIVSGTEPTQIIPIGINLDGNCYMYNSYNRTVKITITKLENCTVAFPDTHVGLTYAQFCLNNSTAYSSSASNISGFGNMGCIHTGDADTKTIVSANQHASLIADYPLYRFRFICEKSDGTFASFVTTNKTSTSNGVVAPNTTSKFLLGGSMFFYPQTTTVAIGSRVANYTIQRSNYDGQELRYGFTVVGGKIAFDGIATTYTDTTINSLPLYLKALDNGDGTWSLDSALSSTDISYHISTSLPTTNDNHIYIKIGEFRRLYTLMIPVDHPIYRWNGSAYTPYGMGGTGGSGGSDEIYVGTSAPSNPSAYKLWINPNEVAVEIDDTTSSSTKTWSSTKIASEISSAVAAAIAAIPLADELSF